MAEDLRLDTRHEPSGQNSTFKFTGRSFSEYVAYSRDVIQRARVDLNGSKERERVIDGNSPFELKPASTCGSGKGKVYQKGILISHGLTDSPYFMRELGSFFQANCFRVMAVLLPGHGTRPGDLLDVKWQEWAKAVAFGVDALSAEADEVYLLGFSTGGALSIYQSLHDKRIKGLFLFSPALKVSPMAVMANWHEAYDWLAPRSKWLDVMRDEDPFKYESFPANAADQIHLLSTLIRSETNGRKFMPPVFIAASEDDATVNTEATLEFFNSAIHPLNTMILYSANQNSSKSDVSEKIKKVNSAFPERRILDSAHTAIVLPPTDSHYGAKGDYANCAYYFPKEASKYDNCKNGKYDYLGEVTSENLKKGIIRRLMYNPNFTALEESLKSFIDSLPH
jgi:esterase/lipase